MASSADELRMARAIELGRAGWGRVQPNPMVGALVLDAEGELVGEGHHAEFGREHAELAALRAAGPAARGGTLYVTLEPCTHQGKTPPCTEAILEAGVRRVVIGASDPSSQASGGAERLRQAGLEVRTGVLEQQARDANPQFFHAHAGRSPFVALKYALSLDGYLSARRGAPTAMTGAAALREAHRLRAGFDAVLVGIGTVLADDPLLTVRHGVEPRIPPARLVADTRLRTPLDGRLMASVEQAPVWLLCGEDVAEARARPYVERGARVLRVAPGPAGLDAAAMLDTLAAEGAATILVEGGGRLGSALLRSGRVHWHYVFHAPIILGGGTPAYEGAAGAEARVWRRIRSLELSDDVMTELAARPDGFD